MTTEYGVFGGLTAPERGLHSDCGTSSGFNRHRRLNQDPCAACIEANRARNRAYEARRAPRHGSRHRKTRKAAA